AESASGIAWTAPRPSYIRNQSFFVSDNEEHWQLRRLAWLVSLSADELWQEDDAAPFDARLDFDPLATLEVYLRHERNKC
ncbi:MAG: hypothetical protein KC457_14840, partial [Myxococcales bacterium]|nr:hypothetical protein [Myxococcales bacterium]